jgi:hypothetical protein
VLHSKKLSKLYIPSSPLLPSHHEKRVVTLFWRLKYVCHCKLRTRRDSFEYEPWSSSSPHTNVWRSILRSRFTGSLIKGWVSWDADTGNTREIHFWSSRNPESRCVIKIPRNHSEIIQFTSWWYYISCSSCLDRELLLRSNSLWSAKNLYRGFYLRHSTTVSEQFSMVSKPYPGF